MLPECFFKYMDVASAKLVLENQTFRYSSPIKFNDPFDIQHDLKPDYDLNEFPHVLMEEIERFVLSDSPIPNTDHPLTRVILRLREESKISGYRKSEVEKKASPLFDFLLSEIKENISLINSHWQESMRSSRVFCVTEDRDNLLMWAHYAKDHTGVVFQIATLAELDTPLSVAKKVKYKIEPIQYHTLTELVLWTLFGLEPDFSTIEFSSHAYRKSEIWSYENEWRVLDMCNYSNKQDEFVDHKFISKQLQKVILGCKFDDKNLNEVIGLAKKINPDVEILKAKNILLNMN